eukprot:GFUD01113131.1.p1 GENE.GFUD01113131.1~~GFUD01113131.1.p1  ORF type:complete len:107 (-),score=24.92 GFUD01113131.1:52-372(-)
MLCRNGQTICRRTGRSGKPSISEFEITTTTTSCGRNNNMCLDTKPFSSPIPSYLPPHQTGNQEYQPMTPDVLKSKEIPGVISNQDDTKSKESYENSNKLENGKSDL